MLVVKFLAEKEIRNSNLKKIINGVNRYVKNYIGKSATIKEDGCIEIRSGSNSHCDSDIEIEILIKKKIHINKKDLDNKFKLDKIVKEIKMLCEKAKEVEEYKYTPINFRNKNDNK